MRAAVSQDWESIEGAISRHVLEQSQKCLNAYRENPPLVLEHANIERATAQGGYGRRQLFELVQNGADALIGMTGAIRVLLTKDALYCANEGAPIDSDGVTAILQSYVSMKRGQQIGRFGLGFKSVLGVSDHPEFYSRSGSFIFDSEFSEQAIRAVAPDAKRFPALRIAMPEDPKSAARGDPILRELMGWATTVVKLPLNPQRGGWLRDDLRDFPGQFLLFVPHVEVLSLEDRTTGTPSIREIRIVQIGDELELTEPGSNTRWRVFSRRHTPSKEARSDAGELADREDVPIAWAVPTSGQLREGAFWAFFPTESRTTLSGILNAPWKTNEDRQNLLPGAFNVELLDAAANMIAEAIPSFVGTKRSLSLPRSTTCAGARVSELGRSALGRGGLRGGFGESMLARPTGRIEKAERATNGARGDSRACLVPVGRHARSTGRLGPSLGHQQRENPSGTSSVEPRW